ncbi:MAG: leucine-rich repeat domain-containing protein, partial [Clostridia bacterium]
MPKTAHAFATEWTVDVAPTETTDGTESRHCTTPGCTATIDSRVAYFGTSGLSYNLLAGDTYEVTGIGTAKDSAIIIPMKYNGKLVTSIGKDAFSGCATITSVRILSGIKAIGNGAFAGCSGLTSIVVDAGNTTYKSETNCVIETASNKLLFGCKTSVIPTSVTAIGDNAFQNCSGLTSITLPTSLKTIGSNAFSGCSGLKRVAMPKGVTDIGVNAFDGAALTVYCEGTEVSKPTGWIANWNGTSAVNWSSEGSAGFTFTHSKDSLSYIVSSFNGTDTEIIIPAIHEGKFVTAIADAVAAAPGVFEGKNTLTKITIPDSVTTIGAMAF